MPMLRSYICPSCAGSFKFLHHPSDEPPPRFCPLCAWDSESEDLPMDYIAGLSAPHIQNRAVVQGADQTYAGMEAGAQGMIDQAVAMTGADASDFDSMKITNLQDNLREGDIAAVPVDNSVSRAMAASPGLSGFQGANALGLAAQAHSGVAPHAGMQTAHMVRQFHGAGNNPTPEAPTVETLRRGHGTTF